MLGSSEDISIYMRQNVCMCWCKKNEQILTSNGSGQDRRWGGRFHILMHETAAENLGPHDQRFTSTVIAAMHLFTGAHTVQKYLPKLHIIFGYIPRWVLKICLALYALAKYILTRLKNIYKTAILYSSYRKLCMCFTWLLTTVTANRDAFLNRCLRRFSTKFSGLHGGTV